MTLSLCWCHLATTDLRTIAAAAYGREAPSRLAAVLGIETETIRGILRGRSACGPEMRARIIAACLAELPELRARVATLEGAEHDR